MHNPTPDQMRAEVEKRVRVLFLGDSTSLISLQITADSMIDMQGIESFHTRLPWRLQLIEGTVFIGESENLNSAVKDVSNQIKFLLKSYPETEKATLLIDDTRLSTNAEAL